MAPPKEELTKSKVTVTCLVSDFFPPEVYVEWQKNGQPVENYKNTQPTLDTDESYFLYSKLSVDRNTWESGESFTCSVLHEALHNHHTEKTLSHSPGK